MRVIHRQFSQFYDRLTETHFEPTLLEGRFVALAVVTDEEVLTALLARGFELHPLDVPEPEPEPTPEPEPEPTRRRRS